MEKMNVQPGRRGSSPCRREWQEKHSSGGEVGSKDYKSSPGKCCLQPIKAHPPKTPFRCINISAELKSFNVDFTRNAAHLTKPQTQRQTSAPYSSHRAAQLSTELRLKTQGSPERPCLSSRCLAMRSRKTKPPHPSNYLDNIGIKQFFERSELSKEEDFLLL